MKISASILSADFANLEKEIRLVESAGADMIHIDVMDGHFVPNLTFGPCVIKDIRPITKLPFDVHLMIENPEKWIDIYAKAGADIITIHPEATKNLRSTILAIKDAGAKAGVSLMPDTTPEVIDSILQDIDLILVMSVHPGFGGQSFMHSQIDKILMLSQKIAGTKITLAVDGGINRETAKLCAMAGANHLVAGSYIFSGDYKERIDNLRKI